MKHKNIERVNKTYRVNVKCINCSWGATLGNNLDIKVGTPVAKVKCPHCGCKYLTNL